MKNSQRNVFAMRVLAILFAILGAGFLAGCSSSKVTIPFDLSKASYVGSASCVQCHREQVDKHAGSHHALAMQIAGPQTVLGDFNNAEYEHFNVHHRMYRDGDKFMVQTEGPDGQLHDYAISYVFGLTPLQQYMVEFPAEQDSAEQNSALTKSLPRIQVLPLCWDTDNKKWFYLDPPDVKTKLDPHDDLHWTGIAQRWNTMCAECHSTNYQKGFSEGKLVDHAKHAPETVNQAGGAIGNYKSTFSEINVACEACHGPASVHVELSKKSSPGWNRDRGYGLANLKKSAENQIQSCAPCHARRGVIYPDFKAGDNYFDHYQEQLLEWPIYYPDGQVLDEDYIHGSFLQSKMYHKGIRCTDCHDPHTATLKHQGNQVCTSCHQHPAAKYDSPAHHFHQAGSAGASCVNCHMPPTTYMEVDARHDHSLRSPRPDMSLKMGTPNACTGCHLKLENVAEEKRPQLKLYQDWMQAARDGDAEVKAEIDRADRWCNEACDKWYGEKRRRDEHWGTAIHAGQNRQPDAIEKLVKLLKARGELAPAIARATALQVLANVDAEVAGEEAILSLSDSHPLVRAAAARTVVGHKQQTRSISALEDLLKDPVRSVRIAAASQLLQYDASLRSAKSRADLDKALIELREGLAYSNDRAGSHLTLGTMAEQLGVDRQAMEHYQTAIVVEPAMAGPRTNLAAILTRNLETATAMPDELRKKLEKQVQDLRATELELLKRDVSLLPNPPAPLIYRLGLSLYLAGEEEQAAEKLIKAAELEVNDVGYAETAAMILEKLKRWGEAIQWAEEAVKRSSGSDQSRAILQRIREQALK
jgi:predicted CXXCH cytochrome family protein